MAFWPSDQGSSRDYCTWISKGYYSGPSPTTSYVYNFFLHRSTSKFYLVLANLEFLLSLSWPRRSLRMSKHCLKQLREKILILVLKKKKKIPFHFRSFYPGLLEQAIASYIWIYCLFQLSFSFLKQYLGIFYAWSYTAPYSGGF